MDVGLRSYVHSRCHGRDRARAAAVVCSCHDATSAFGACIHSRTHIMTILTSSSPGAGGAQAADADSGRDRGAYYRQHSETGTALRGGGAATTGQCAGQVPRLALPAAELEPGGAAADTCADEGAPLADLPSIGASAGAEADLVVNIERARVEARS